MHAGSLRQVCDNRASNAMPRRILLPTPARLLTQAPAADRSPRFHTYIGFGAVTGQEATVAELTQCLGQIELRTLLRLIARVNNILIQRGNQMERTQNQLVRHLLDGRLSAKLNAIGWGTRGKRECVFHRQQQLYLLNQAVRSSRPDIGNEIGDATCHAFGRACLLANDLLDRCIEPVSDGHRYINPLSRILPSTELRPETDAFPLISRAHRLWVESGTDPRLREQADYIDFNSEFAANSGVELADFLAALVALVAHCFQFDPDDPSSCERLDIRREVFGRSTEMPAAIWTRVLDELAITPRELARRLEQDPRQSASCDFTLNRQYPLLALSAEVLTCYDLVFLARTATEGIYWRVHDSQLPADRGKFQSFFGKVFAWHITSALERLYGRPGPLAPRVLTDVHFKDGHQEAGDSLLDLGDVLVVMEIKSSLLTTRAKYSGDATVLETDLRGKFVESSGRKPKGVGQLAAVIRRLAEGRETTPRLDVRAFKVIIPVLVTYDPSVATSLAHLYLEDSFREKVQGLPASSPRIGRLAVLSSRDAECLEGIARKFPLAEVFRGYENYRPMASDFYDYLWNRYPAALDSPETGVRESFLASCHDAAARLFPAEHERRRNSS